MLFTDASLSRNIAFSEVGDLADVNAGRRRRDRRLHRRLRTFSRYAHLSMTMDFATATHHSSVWRLLSECGPVASDITPTSVDEHATPTRDACAKPTHHATGEMEQILFWIIKEQHKVAVSGMAMVLSSLMNKEEHKARVAMVPNPNRLPPLAIQGRRHPAPLCAPKCTAGACPWSPHGSTSRRAVQGRRHPAPLCAPKCTADAHVHDSLEDRLHVLHGTSTLSFPVRSKRSSWRKVQDFLTDLPRDRFNAILCDARHMHMDSSSDCILDVRHEDKNGLVILPRVLEKGPCLPPVLLPFFRPFFHSFPVLCQLEHEKVRVQLPTLRATPCPESPNNKLLILTSPGANVAYAKKRMVTRRKIVWHMFSSLSAPVSRSNKKFEEAARDMMQNLWHVCAVPQSEKAQQAERRESRAACTSSGRPSRGKENRQTQRKAEAARHTSRKGQVYPRELSTSNEGCAHTDEEGHESDHGKRETFTHNCGRDHVITHENWSSASPCTNLLFLFFVFCFYFV